MLYYNYYFLGDVMFVFSAFAEREEEETRAVCFGSASRSQEET